MNTHFEIALLLVVAFAFSILFLWLLNIKSREFRYHQFLSAAIAIPYAILVYLFFASDAFPGLFSWFGSFWERNLSVDMHGLWQGPLTAFTFFWLALLLYLPIKKLLIWLLRTGKSFDDPPAISLGVYEERKKRVLLKNDYYYPLKYMFISVLVFSVVYGLFFFSYSIGAPFPAYGLLLVFIFSEIFWFLNGTSEFGEIEISSVSTPVKHADFHTMWTDYKQTWEDNLSLAFIRRSEYTKWLPSEIGGEMLIKNYKKNAIFKNIHKHMVDLLNKGKKIIIFIPDNFQPLADLEDSDMYKIVKENLFGFDYTSQFVTTEMMNLKLEASIFITSIDKFLLHSINIEEDYELFNWFKDLRLVLYFEYDISLIESPESSVSASSIIKYLSGNPQDLTSIVFAEDREAQQASWKSNLKTNPQMDREIKINDSESENTYYLGWKGEKPFEAGLFNNFANRYIGPLASLAPLPYLYGVKSVDIKPGKDPFLENFENAIEDKDDWQTRYRDLQVLTEKSLKEFAQVHHHNLSISHREEKVMVAYDSHYNAPFLFKYFNEFGRVRNLINIISPPHILRAYFNDNFEYFSKNPIKPLSYMLIAGDKHTLALALLEKLVKCKLSLKELAQDFSEIENNQQIVITQLRELFKDTYNFDIINTSYLQVTESPQGELLFSLKTDIKDQIELFKKVEFIDQTNNLIFKKNKNLLFQKYLIGQVHAFGGRTYTIRRINNIGNDIVVKLENTELKQYFSYMEKRSVELDMGKLWKKIESKNPNNEYAINIYSKSFSVSTSGYFELNDGNSLAGGKYTFHTTNINDRPYKNGRVCKISFANYSAVPNFRKANITLRIALEEVIKVLFPDSYHYLIIRSFGHKNAAVPNNILSKYYSLDNNLDSAVTGDAGIYIFEDSIFDMGHLKSILENIDYIFKLLDDYFVYLIEKTQSKTYSFKDLEESTVAESEYFLSYKLKEIKHLRDFPEPLDIQSAKNLTARCLRVHNDITYDRTGNKIPTGPVKQTFAGFCSSCGKPGCGESNAELRDDGRILCHDCKKNNQRSQTDEQDLTDRMKKYFQQHQNLPTIAQVKFTDLREIRSNFSLQTIHDRFPHANIKVSRKSKRYEIFIENYRNELETCTALLHAFTHIWHLENIDVETLTQENNYLDGHALKLMETYLRSDHLPIGVTPKEAINLLREIQVYQSNYYQLALQALNREAHNRDLFIYLSMNYQLFGSDDFELFEP